jgi:cyanate permease
MAAVGLLPETLEDRGMSATMAGIYVSISTWTVMVANMVGPYISDRFGLRKLFMWPFLLLSAAAITFFGVLMDLPLILMIILYSFGLGTALPLFHVAIVENERIGANLAGSALGILGTVAGIGPIVIPIMMGAIMDSTGEYWPGFLLLAILLAIGAVMGALIKETGLSAKGYMQKNPGSGSHLVLDNKTP